MIFSKGMHSHFDFYLNNVRLEVGTSFKYLGIHFKKMETGIGGKKDYHNMLRSLYTICFNYFDKLNLLHLKNANYSISLWDQF